MNERLMTVTEASRHFSDLVNRTYYRGESTVLFRSGEAVAKLVPVGGCSVLGKDVAMRWKKMRHLDTEEAADFASDVEAAKEVLEMPEPAWD
jgi:antitoxin (DNA-binding transcriptional repressor) of toxin-antitoxin stability system